MSPAGIAEQSDAGGRLTPQRCGKVVDAVLLTSVGKLDRKRLRSAVAA